MKKETFCRYIRQYETDMFRFAKSIVGTQADGEDAMQESILKAYENIDTLRSRRKFKAWIFQILANECYQILRNRKKHAGKRRLRMKVLFIECSKRILTDWKICARKQLRLIHTIELTRIRRSRNLPAIQLKDPEMVLIMRNQRVILQIRSHG